MVAANADTPIVFSLSPGQAGDAPEGRKLLQAEGKTGEPCFLIMDRAYEGDETRELAESLGCLPVVPPKSNRLEPWSYDRELYKRRNEVERLFRKLKGFRRLATRYDKLDVMFFVFIVIACSFQVLK
jgi:transposase